MSVFLQKTVKRQMKKVTIRYIVQMRVIMWLDQTPAVYVLLVWLLIWHSEQYFELKLSNFR